MIKKLSVFLCMAMIVSGCGSGNQRSTFPAAENPETSSVFSATEPSPSAVSAVASAEASPAAASDPSESSTGKAAEIKRPDSDPWEVLPLSIHDIRFTVPEKVQKSVPKLKPEQFPKEDGSTATLPLSKALYRISTGATAEEADTAIIHTKTTSSYYKLLEGENDLVIAYEPSDQFYADLKKSDAKLNIQPIGKDALVFLMNEGNPVRSLTNAQIRDIYSGKISNWTSLGGADRKIIAFQRPENSGSQNLMKKLVMKDTAMAKAPESWVEGEMGDLIDSVASYNNSKNALGYSVYFYARNMYEQPGLAFMSVNGVAPDNDTIRTGKYPYVNEFYAAVRADAPRDSAQYRLFSWLTGNDGQSLIESLGYVSIRRTDYADTTLTKEKFTGRLQLDRGKALAVDGEKVLDAPGTLLLSDTAENMTFIKDYVIQACSESGQAVVDTNVPQIVRKKIKNGWVAGVRDMQSGSWLIEPHYREIKLHDNGIYEAVFISTAAEDEIQDLYDRNGKRIASAERGENAVIGTDFIWISDQKKKTIRILDLNGRQTAKVVLPSACRDFTINPDAHGFVLINTTDQYDLSAYLFYRENGELYFDAAMVPREILRALGTDPAHFKISGYLPGGKIADLTVLKENPDQEGTTCLYDILQKKLLSHGEELLPGKAACLVKPASGEPYVIDKNGKLAVSASGKPFTELLSGSTAMIRTEKNTVWFSDPDQAREYVFRGDFGPSPLVEYEASSNLITISNYSDQKNITGYLFHGDTLLMGGKNVHAGSGESGPFACDNGTDESIHAYYDAPYYFHKKQGRERCAMENGAVCILVEGNTYSVIDQDNHTVIKMLLHQ